MAKKTSPYIPILLGTGAAIAIFFFATRKASAAQLPPSPMPTPIPTPTPGTTPSGGPRIQPAVSFPYANLSLPEIQTIEKTAAADVNGKWIDAVQNAAAELGVSEGSQASKDRAREVMGIPENQGVATWTTDQVFFGLYDVGKIPDKSERGSGWQPYVDSWTRTFDFVKTLPWTD